jgi:hypothetical protein
MTPSEKPEAKAESDLRGVYVKPVLLHDVQIRRYSLGLIVMVVNALFSRVRDVFFTDGTLN